jgi:hypothetical protein
VVLSTLRETCARVAAAAEQVRINAAQVPLYAASLPTPPPAQLELLSDRGERELAAWYWLTLDAINFGSGWFPTLRKRPGRSGYATVSTGLRRHFDTHGPWSAAQLQGLDPPTVAAILDQDPDHELMAHFAASLNDLGRRLERDHGGDPLALVDACHHSAAELVDRLAGWDCFRDVSDYRDASGTVAVPFLKRAQITAADLARSGAASFGDLERLTLFADNLVPHVLRLDGILEFDAALVARIDAEALIEHGSPEEVEIRACALHAVELIVAASPEPVTAAQLDELLWQRGQGRRYKALPRHRSRCRAY